MEEAEDLAFYIQQSYPRKTKTEQICLARNTKGILQAGIEIHETVTQIHIKK